MAKVMFGGGVAEIRGSIAGTVFSRNRGGAYTRNRVTPLNPASSNQQLVRSAITDLSTQWSTVLSQGQRDAWTSFSQAFPTTNVFGASIVLTGLQMFVRQNTPLAYIGETLLLSAPVNLDVDALTDFSAAVDDSANTMVLTFAPTPVPADHVLQISSTPAVSPGIGYFKNKLRQITALPAATATGEDVAAEWTVLFGAQPAVGQKVAFQARLLSLITGTPSTPLQFDAIVVA